MNKDTRKTLDTLHKHARRLERQAERADYNAIDEQANTLLELNAGQLAAAEVPAIRAVGLAKTAQQLRDMSNRVNISAAQIEQAARVKLQTESTRDTLNLLQNVDIDLDVHDVSELTDEFEKTTDSLEHRTITLQDALGRSNAVSSSSSDVHALMLGLAKRYDVTMEDDQRLGDLEVRLRSLRNSTKPEPSQ